MLLDQLEVISAVDQQEIRNGHHSYNFEVVRCVTLHGFGHFFAIGLFQLSKKLLGGDLGIKEVLEIEVFVEFGLEQFHKDLHSIKVIITKLAANKNIKCTVTIGNNDKRRIKGSSNCSASYGLRAHLILIFWPCRVLDLAFRLLCLD